MALVWSKLLPLLSIVGLHSSTEPLEQCRAHVRVLERGEVEGAALVIPLQIGQDMLGFCFGRIRRKAVEIFRVRWRRRDTRQTSLLWCAAGWGHPQTAINS